MTEAHYAARNFSSKYAKLYSGSGSVARYLHSRLYCILRELASVPGGDVLDVGCGPGVMVRKLLDNRPGDFRITAVDQSIAMAEACAATIAGHRDATALAGRAEALPFGDESFDVVLAMGVLEYTNTRAALAEIARVARTDGLVLLTMHNPESPYRFVERHFYQPVQRMLRAARSILKTGTAEPATRSRVPLRTMAERHLREMAKALGLHPIDAVYFDVAFVVPPFDRYFGRWRQKWRTDPARTVGHGWRKRLGTAYVLILRRPKRTGEL